MAESAKDNFLLMGHAFGPVVPIGEQAANNWRSPSGRAAMADSGAGDGNLRLRTGIEPESKFRLLDIPFARAESSPYEQPGASSFMGWKDR
jgi:hypothetical protein